MTGDFNGIIMDDTFYEWDFPILMTGISGHHCRNLIGLDPVVLIGFWDGEYPLPAPT